MNANNFTGALGQRVFIFFCCINIRRQRHLRLVLVKEKSLREYAVEHSSQNKCSESDGVDPGVQIYTESFCVLACR